MPTLGPASIGLIVFAAFLIAGLCAAALGMFLADRFRVWRERRDVYRCLRAAREEAAQEGRHELNY